VSESATTPREVVEAMYEAINAHDFEAGFALLSADFEWNEPSQAFHGGRHRGFADIRERLEAQLEVFDEFTVEPDELRVRGERVGVAVRQRARGGSSGVELEIRIGHLWTIQDGEITRLDVFAARDEAMRALEAASDYVEEAQVKEPDVDPEAPLPGFELPGWWHQ
jgi:ketosteroid isomerase-like protein